MRLALKQYMSKKSIEFLNFVSLRGPNMWTYRPVIEAWVDIGELEDFPSNLIPGFHGRLSALLPSLVEHRCSYGERGGFLRRVEEGTWPGHILEHVTLELQNLAGMAGGFGKARSTSTRGVYKVVVRAWHEDITKKALHFGRDLVMAVIEDKPFDVAAAVEVLRDMADDLLLGPSTQNIVDAATAKDRRIPAIRLNEGNLVQLGYGRKSRRIWTAETDATSAIAEGIAGDKDLTKTLLSSCGVAVPEGSIVKNPEEAWEAAEDIGLPVVVKPVDGNHARGVSMNLTAKAEIEAAWHVADAEGSGVIVERFIPGIEHRLLVVGGKLVAATRGEEAWIVGDGRSSVVELIDSQLNTDPRRGEEEEYPLTPIILEREPVVRLELERQGLDGISVPAQGLRVLVQRNANLAFDCTDEVHPETACTVALAARIIGLDIAGVDLVTQDISKPLAGQGGAIVEVNAGPGLLMHIKPAVGTPRPVGQAIVDHLFPNNGNGRIPVVGISGSANTTVVARLTAHLTSLAGNYTGLACADGLFLNSRRLENGDCAHWEPAQRLLMNRNVQAVVVENGPRTQVAEGMAYDRCQVGVVTRLDPQALLPDHYIDDPDHLYNVLRTQIDLVLPTGVGVLNADDERVAEMAELCDGEVIFFARASDAPPLVSHLGSGARAVFVSAGQLVLAQGANRTGLAALAAIPMAGANPSAAALTALLAAVAAAWGLGIAPELIRAGIETFTPEQTN